jgi:mRNA-degrading endonuclease RelE of RelBE toxin-antitoxin system
MEKRYKLVFDAPIKAKLDHILLKSSYKELIRKWFDELEKEGSKAGKLLDNHTWLYELKNKKPPLRLYYHYQESTGKVILFDIEMKTSEKKQNKLIRKLKYRIFKFLHLLWYTPFLLNFLSIPKVVYRA